MTKKLAIIAIILCVATVANAERSMKVGARLGYSMQKVGSIDIGMPGMGAGVVFDIPVGSIFISPELAFLYRNNWNMQDYDMSDNVIDWTQPEMAISIPLTFKFFIESFYSSIGFQVDIPIAAEECYDKDCIKMDGKKAREYEFGSLGAYERSAVDIGLVWGLGYMITSNFGIDFRSVVGFLPHFKYKVELVPGVPIKAESDSMSSYGLGISYFF
jgi:hypothetical protein